MFNGNDQDQVGVLSWNKHKIDEDQFLPRLTNEVNILLTFGECNKKQRGEDASNTTRSKVESFGAKHEFLNCNMEKRSGNSCQDCSYSNLQMDGWSDLPYSSCVLNDGFNDGSDQDSVIKELMNDISDASNLYPGVGIMTIYDYSSEMFPNNGISSLSKPSSISSGDAMQLDGELEQFGHDDKADDSFLDCDWANIEDLDDLDKIFKNNDSFDGNEKVHNANFFYNTSADTTGNTSQLVTVPADGQSQTWRVLEEEKGKGMSFQALSYSYSSEKQPMTSSEVQGSNVNPLHAILSPPSGQECLSKNQTQGATTSIDSTKEYTHKHSTPEGSYLNEQYQPQVMPSSIYSHSIEVAIYHQLQYAMQKLDLSVRLNIRDSLFRLASSAMERSNASDRSCADKTKDEYKSSSMHEESNNHHRSSIMPDLESVTNPIDRIVAHLLFNNSSGFYSLPIGDGNVLMSTSM